MVLKATHTQGLNHGTLGNTAIHRNMSRNRQFDLPETLNWQRWASW